MDGSLDDTLARIPIGAELSGVTATPVRLDGRDVLRVTLDDQTVAGVAGVDFIDQPTFVVLPGEFRDGRIDVDLRGTLVDGAPGYARAFAGIAYRISGDRERFEAVYVRPLNGRKAAPPAERLGRAVQYFAYPEWPFDRLRAEFPPDRFEVGADIGPNEWMRLGIDVSGELVTVSIDGTDVLVITQALGSAEIGRIGLFVDIGTEAFFSDLSVTPR